MNSENESKGSMQRERKVPWFLLTAGAAAVALFAVIFWPGAPATFAEDAEVADMVVYKTASCSCCGKWVEHVRSAGLKVEVVNVTNTQPTRARLGVPPRLGSCHTAAIGDYWVEGHVPVDLIQQLIAEKPKDIRGLAVPGMVMGSPGMEGPNPVRYNIVAHDGDGNTTIFATRQGSAH